MLKLLHLEKDFPPRESQIDVLYGLIFGLSDVLMIARTGEGKSLVFQAFTMLTGMITIQLVPLNRLSAEQAEDIRRMNEDNASLVNVVNITAETKQLDQQLYDKIEAGEY